MRKIFFFDIDDTLLETKEGGEVSKENIYAVKELLKKGYDVYLATGKNYDMAKDILDITGVQNSITSNGNVIIEGDELIYSNSLKQEDINYLLDLVKDRDDVILGGQGNGGAYLLQDNEYVYDKYVKPIFTNLSAGIPKYTKDLNEKLLQCWFVGVVEGIEVDKKFKTYRWNEFGLDVLYNNASKAVGIQYLLDNKYKGEDVELYGFGDSLNDVEMFNLVDNAVAMSNAKEELKEIASVVTDNSQNKGVYNYLVNEKLIEEKK